MLDLTSHQMMAIPRSALAALRAALLRDGGPEAAAYLQDAGYAAGGALYESFSAWLREQGNGSPDDLELPEFEHQATAYLREAGWGSLAVASHGDDLATLDSPDWAEADPEEGAELPTCHFSTGVLASFFGRVAAAPLAVLEVECRSVGDARCRFLVGSAETMQRTYEEMAAGG